jgi:small subunit ribosomal protein S17
MSDENMQNKPAAARRPRRLAGVVVCCRADKTARVRVERRARHPLHEKIVRRRVAVQAHDAENACQEGDKVIVEESPRFSKTKAWRVVSREAKQ